MILEYELNCGNADHNAIQFPPVSLGPQRGESFLLQGRRGYGRESHKLLHASSTLAPAIFKICAFGMSRFNSSNLRPGDTSVPGNAVRNSGLRGRLSTRTYGRKFQRTGAAIFWQADQGAGGNSLEQAATALYRGTTDKPQGIEPFFIYG